jgi:acetyl-CoA synthetase (ADP-forming)
VPLHKSDMGAVKLNLASSEEVEEARRDMAARLRALGIDATGFLVEEMAQPGIELVIGGMIDPQLGPMLMIGAGGVYAEILDDVSFRLCPFVRRDAEEMLGELKIAPILRGARGRPPVAIEPIIDALMALGGADGLFVRHADVVTEFDINPLIARPDGLVAVDARFVLGGSQAHG